MHDLITEIIGWIGAGLLSLCGVPQLIKTYKTKTTKGLSFGMLLCWLLGEIFMVTYIILTAFEWPLLVNFSTNILIVALTVILYIRYK